MSFFVESAKSDLYKLYRPKKSPQDAPRLWWKYSILATIYLTRHSQRADLWTVVSAKNMDVLHNLRKALKVKSLMVDPSSLLEIFDDNEPLRKLEREMEVLRKENDLLRQIVAKAFTPNVILEDTKSLDYCQIFTEDGQSITISLRDLLNPTEATVENRTLKSTPSKPSTASNSPIRAALTSAGVMTGGSREDSLNPSMMELPPLVEGTEESGSVTIATTSHATTTVSASVGPRSTILKATGASAAATTSATAAGAFTSLNAVAPVSPYLDLSSSARVPSAKIYREEPEIMRSAKHSGGNRATMMSGSSSKKMTGSESARAKRNATIVARANEAMIQIESSSGGSSQSAKVSPLKTTTSSTEGLEDSLSSLMKEPSAVMTSVVTESPTSTTTTTSTTTSTTTAAAAGAAGAVEGPTSYNLAVAALQVTISGSDTSHGKNHVTIAAPVSDDSKSVRSGLSSIKTKNTSATTDNSSIVSGSSSKHSPSSKRSPPKVSNSGGGGGGGGVYRSAKVVPVSASMLNKSEKAAFDIIVSAKKGGGGGGGGVSGSNVSAKAAATVALTPVEIALMKSPLSKEVAPKTSPPKDGMALTKQPMMF